MCVRVCVCVGQFGCVCACVCSICVRACVPMRMLVLVCAAGARPVRASCVREYVHVGVCEGCAFVFDRDSVRLFMRVGACMCVGVVTCVVVTCVLTPYVCARERWPRDMATSFLCGWFRLAGAVTTIAYQGHASIRCGKGAEV